MVLKKLTKIAAAASVVALALAACGVETETEHNHSHEGHAHGASSQGTETAKAMPRVAVATESGVSIFDENLAEVASYELPSRPSLTLAHDDRHVVANRQHDNESSIIDAGAWKQGHGDHFHYYTGEPALFEEVVKGAKPVHVVPNAGAEMTAVFADDDGAASLITSENVREGELDDLPKVEANLPHHGVVIPMPDDHYLVTATADKETPLPDTIELRHGAKDVEQTYTCKRMHGEVARGGNAAFGCADSVLVIKDGEGVNIPTPELGDERVGALVANADFSTLVGKAGDKLVFVKDDSTVIAGVDEGVSISNLAIAPDGHVATLGTNGKLYVFDATGNLEHTMQVTGQWEKPEGHSGIAPAVAAGEYAAANTVWVSEPAVDKVYMIDLFTKEIAATADVPGEPTSLVVANVN
ncbi:MAG: hypothetical protein PUK40_03805 [Actinomycetaceae bacterium]|nr:hypothetical protein [Arcanobacterium sp.]MDD7505063.1 hypothetical protein [Actinomycetaceae bacterium]MDY6143754.1 hypothetical protein [Arcanobacterium sp.]